MVLPLSRRIVRHALAVRNMLAKVIRICNERTLKMDGAKICVRTCAHVQHRGVVFLKYARGHPRDKIYRLCVQSFLHPKNTHRHGPRSHSIKVQVAKGKASVFSERYLAISDRSLYHKEHNRSLRSTCVWTPTSQ